MNFWLVTVMANSPQATMWSHREKRYSDLHMNTVGDQVHASVAVGLVSLRYLKINEAIDSS